MGIMAQRTTRSPTVPIGPSAGKRPLASAAPAWTLTIAPRMEASGERCDIDYAKLGRSPRAGRLEPIAGTGGMASRCVRLVSFIRPR